MFELLAIPQVFGIFPCIPSKQGNFTISSKLIAINAGIITLLILLHCILLTQTNDKFQNNFFTFLSDNVFLGLSCTLSHIIILTKRNSLCKIINQIILLRNLLPIQSIITDNGYQITALFVTRIVIGLIGSCSVILIDQRMFSQTWIFNCMFFYNSLINIIFLVIISELCMTLMLYNKCLKTIGTAFVYKRTFYLNCLLLFESINQQFSFIHVLKVINSFTQCVVSVNYVADSPPESKDLMLFCMVLWSIGYVFEIVAVFTGCLMHKKEVHETAKLLEIVSLQPGAEHLYPEIETFSLQLYHIDVDFDACGFFKFNYRFLFSMAGTIVTYALIIKQIRY